MKWAQEWLWWYLNCVLALRFVSSAHDTETLLSNQQIASSHPFVVNRLYI